MCNELTEADVKAILFHPDGHPTCFAVWNVGQRNALLDDNFTVEELEAIVWCMRNNSNLLAD